MSQPASHIPSTPSPLLERVNIGGLALRNHIVMAPMTREQSVGGVPDDKVAEYYRRRAAGGVGLIITEGSPPDLPGAFGAAVPRFYGEDALAGWAKVVAAVHAEGAAIVPQLWHVGAFEPSIIGMPNSIEGVERLSPSGLAAPGKPLGRSMRDTDIESVIDSFARAAADARRIGFDGVEIHGAHGYLFDQFLWPRTNHRDDGFGPADPTRFACEVIRECRRRVGPDFPILLRISQWKQLDYAARLAETPAALEALLLPLVDAGVDIFHCSTRRFWEPEFAEDPRTFAGWVRAISGRPTIIVGSVTLGTDFKAETGKTFAAIDTGDVARLERLLADGEFDLVAIGRALIANPEWPRMLAEGRLNELRPFEKWMLEGL